VVWPTGNAETDPERRHFPCSSQRPLDDAARRAGRSPRGAR